MAPMTISSYDERWNGNRNWVNFDLSTSLKFSLAIGLPLLSGDVSYVKLNRSNSFIEYYSTLYIIVDYSILYIILLYYIILHYITLYYIIL